MSLKCSCCNTNVEYDQTLDDIIEQHKNIKGNLIPILHEIQKTYGYIPSDSFEKLSRELNVSLSEIYGVITFYHHFSQKPKGKYNISVCLGTACYVKGAAEILEAFKAKLGIDVSEITKDGLFSLEVCRCLGACGLAPAILINDKVYGRLTEDEVERIIKGYREIEA